MLGWSRGNELKDLDVVLSQILYRADKRFDVTEVFSPE